MNFTVTPVNRPVQTNRWQMSCQSTVIHTNFLQVLLNSTMVNNQYASTNFGCLLKGTWSLTHLKQIPTGYSPYSYILVINLQLLLILVQKSQKTLTLERQNFYQKAITLIILNWFKQYKWSIAPLSISVFLRNFLQLNTKHSLLMAKKMKFVDKHSYCYM